MAGTKRPAEDAPAADVAPPAPKISKKEARRLRKLTPEQKRMMEFRFKIGQCAKDVDAAKALELFDQMKQEGLKIEPYMHRVIINVCSKMEDAAAFKDGAFQVYEDLKARLGESSGKDAVVDETTASALVKLCSKVKDFTACEELIAAMETDHVTPKLRTFGPLLQAHSDAGDLDKCIWVQDKFVQNDLEPTEEDYVALLRVCVKNANAECFYAFLDKFIDDIWQPGPEAWEVLKEWFSSEAAQVDGRKWKITEGTVTKEGVCSVTGDQLQSLELPPQLEAELLEKIEMLVRSDEKRIEQWSEFKQWLEEFGPFDVVIDAANVGYFNQNFDGGGFNYGQIELMVQHYESQGKKVLVVLHQRRTTDEEVPPSHRETIAEWRARHVMFNCQTGNNDDWYWLYAAVKLGGRTLMVSNDEMRDHHFQMIHNRAFGRWKERHQVHYQVRGQRVTVEEPAPFSARPQRIGDVWHFPSREGEASHVTDDEHVTAGRLWLCVALEPVSA